MNVIVLAGGFGTRLKQIITDIPKPMAPINGVPFLEYIFYNMSQYDVEKVILAVGYKSEVIINHFQNDYRGIKIEYSTEDTPLGTGGAIKKAMYMLDCDNAIALNGDTFIDINYDALWEKHAAENNDITIGLKKMHDFDRYGAVKRDGDKIIAFEEKQYRREGYINAGVYAINKRIFFNLDTSKFSFESDILENNINSVVISSYVSNGYFIDIGIPEDFNKAQKELKSYYCNES